MLDYVVGFLMVFGYSASLFAIGLYVGIRSASRTLP